MLDPFLTKVLRTPFDAAGAALMERNVDAKVLTWAGFVGSLVGALLVGVGWNVVAFVVLMASRVVAGLGSGTARAAKPTDFGAYLDIVLDLIVFSAVAAGFALADPANTFAGIMLMICIAGTGAASLALTMFAAKHGVAPETEERPFFYVSALVESSEITLFFLIALIWPHAFPIIGWLFAIACAVTIAQRIFQARAAFGED